MQGRELVGKNIRRIRVALKMSQERLAFDSGVDRSYLGGIERGEENPTVDVLDRIAEILAIDLSDLFVTLDDSELSSGLPRGRKKPD